MNLGNKGRRRRKSHVQWAYYYYTDEPFVYNTKIYVILKKKKTIVFLPPSAASSVVIIYFGAYVVHTSEKPDLGIFKLYRQLGMRWGTDIYIFFLWFFFLSRSQPVRWLRFHASFPREDAARLLDVRHYAYNIYIAYLCVHAI